MNPQVGRWLKECAGEDIGDENKKHILGLTYTMRLLGLCSNTHQTRHHNAEHDSKMTYLIYATLLERANSSFTKPGIENIPPESEKMSACTRIEQGSTPTACVKDYAAGYTTHTCKTTVRDVV